MTSPAGAPGHSAPRRLWKPFLTFLAAFAVVVAAAHAPLLQLPLFWDELGYFVPAALDLYERGLWIPDSTQANVHPPLVPAYLAGVWTFSGYSLAATRAAMLALAALAVMAVFLLAIEMCKETRGVPALMAVTFLLASPLFYTQAMMAQLDMPAMLFTAAALWLFFKDRHLAAALACTALVLVKETGIVAPLVLGAWLWKEGRKEAALYSIPAVVLALWLLLVFRSTGHVFGSDEFARYNLLYPLHPFRFAVALGRRTYALLLADFHWVGTAAIAAGFRALHGRQWRIAGALAAAHLLTVSLLGGAQLERYLLPVMPLFYIAAAAAFTRLGRPRRIIGQTAMACGLLAGFLWNPPYPFPYENNLAMVSFVHLHKAAAEFLERHYPAGKVTTAWPFSDALRRPEFGYVQRPRTVDELKDFQPDQVRRLSQVELFVLYSRDWRRVPVFEGLWRRYFEYAPPVTSEECRRLFGLVPVARWESRGQWIEVLASRPPDPSPRSPAPRV